MFRLTRSRSNRGALCESRVYFDIVIFDPVAAKRLPKSALLYGAAWNFEMFAKLFIIIARQSGACVALSKHLCSKSKSQSFHFEIVTILPRLYTHRSRSGLLIAYSDST